MVDLGEPVARISSEACPIKLTVNTLLLYVDNEKAYSDVYNRPVSTIDSTKFHYNFRRLSDVVRLTACVKVDPILSAKLCSLAEGFPFYKWSQPYTGCA
jgi:hypothetical protein